MPKDAIIPRTDSERVIFYPNFSDNIEAALTAMGLDPALADEAKKQALLWKPSYEKQQKAFDAAKAATTNQQKQNTRSHDAVQTLLNQIKVNPNYTADIQALLGTTPTDTDPQAKAGADQPVIKMGVTAGHPDLKCLKHGHGQIKIMSKRGAETDYSLLSIVTSPHYVDLRPNLLPGQPEQRSYLMIYLDQDQEIGHWSQPATVSVLPQP